MIQVVRKDGFGCARKGYCLGLGGGGKMMQLFVMVEQVLTEDRLFVCKFATEDGTNDCRAHGSGCEGELSRILKMVAQ